LARPLKVTGAVWLDGGEPAASVAVLDPPPLTLNVTVPVGAMSEEPVTVADAISDVQSRPATTVRLVELVA
jgi:hypothetical protein